MAPEFHIDMKSSGGGLKELIYSLHPDCVADDLGGGRWEGYGEELANRREGAAGEDRERPSSRTRITFNCQSIGGLEIRN